jgi:hypothetical protein
MSFRFRSSWFTTFFSRWFKKNRNELSGLKLRIKPGVPFHRL